MNFSGGFSWDRSIDKRRSFRSCTFCMLLSVRQPGSRRFIRLPVFFLHFLRVGMKPFQRPRLDAGKVRRIDRGKLAPDP